MDIDCPGAANLLSLMRTKCRRILGEVLHQLQADVYTLPGCRCSSVGRAIDS